MTLCQECLAEKEDGKCFCPWVNEKDSPGYFKTWGNEWFGVQKLEYKDGSKTWFLHLFHDIPFVWHQKKPNV